MPRVRRLGRDDICLAALRLVSSEPPHHNSALRKAAASHPDDGQRRADGRTGRQACNGLRRQLPSGFHARPAYPASLCVCVHGSAHPKDSGLLAPHVTAGRDPVGRRRRGPGRARRPVYYPVSPYRLSSTPPAVLSKASTSTGPTLPFRRRHGRPTDGDAGEERERASRADEAAAREG